MNSLRSILAFESTRPLEFWAGVASFARGATVALTVAPLGVQASAVAADLVPLGLLGAFGMVCGVVQIRGVIGNHRRMRRAAAIGTSCLAAFFFVACLLGDPFRAQTTTYASAWAAQFYILARIHLDRKRSLRRRAYDVP